MPFVKKEQEKYTAIIFDSYPIHIIALTNYLKSKQITCQDCTIDNTLSSIYDMSEKNKFTDFVFYHFYAHEFTTDSLLVNFKLLRKKFPKSKILIYSDEFRHEILRSLVKTLIDGYFLTREYPDLLLESIKDGNDCHLN